jgi:hypothetical protein
MSLQQRQPQPARWWLASRAQLSCWAVLASTSATAAVPSPASLCPPCPGYEPHSVLPQGICIFSQYAADASLIRNTRILVSSAGFWAREWVGRRQYQAASGLLMVLCESGVGG